MHIELDVHRNRYVDSVTLMQIRDKAMKIPGAVYAEIQMGTCGNIEILREMGFTVPEDTNANDLVFGIAGDSQETVQKIRQSVADMLERKNCDEESFDSLDEIDIAETGYNLVQISLPGEYAVAEAEKAIRMGCNVFIFSDNVSLEDELYLKQLGQEKGCLVMGPDCGVGLINGVCLGAGSIVRKGEIGIVGASGSGAQEVSCIIEKCGFGVSQIIGTGGHDLYPQIGGITMMEGIKRLNADPETKVIALVSKLADLGVMEKVLTYADQMSKPVVAVFLGGDEGLFAGHSVRGAVSLEQCAMLAVELLTGEKHSCGYSDAELEKIAEEEMAKLSPEQKHFRGLFCGGTFTEESLIYFNKNNPNTKLTSNLSNRYSTQLEDPDISVGNAVLDLGAENFTEKLPHPVFDHMLREKRLKAELADPTVAVVMLDFITGPGVDEDPITVIAAICKAANAEERHVTFIASICGSEHDPQNVRAKTMLLRDSGVIVTGSNYQSTKLASLMMAALEKRGC